MIFEKVINPIKVLKVKMIDENEISITLKGVDFVTEQFVSSPTVFEVIDSKEKADMVGAEIASRMIRACIKSVEGVQIKEGDEVKDFHLDFETNGLITKDSYNLVMRILNSALDPKSILDQISEFYKETTQVKLYEVKKKS